MTAHHPQGPELLAQAIGVTRRFGAVVALDEVSLAVPAGQLVSACSARTAPVRPPC